MRPAGCAAGFNPRQFFYSNTFLNKLQVGFVFPHIPETIWLCAIKDLHKSRECREDKKIRVGACVNTPPQTYLIILRIKSVSFNPKTMRVSTLITSSIIYLCLRHPSVGVNGGCAFFSFTRWESSTSEELFSLIIRLLTRNIQAAISINISNIVNLIFR